MAVVHIAIALFSIAIVVALWKMLSNSNANLPPGPPGIPVIGHLHLLRSTPPHILFQKLSTRYGQILSLRFGQVPVVVASSAAAAAEFLKTHDAIFASRPPLAAGRAFGHDADVVFSPYGDHWRHLRKIATVELLTTRRIDMFREARMEELRSLCRSLLAAEAAAAIDLRTKLSALTFNIITFMLMGKRCFGRDLQKEEAASEFLDLIAEIFDVCGEFPIVDYFPWFPRFLDPVDARMQTLSRRLDEFLDANIAEHEERREEARTSANSPTVAIQDFVDVLLELRDNGDERLHSRSLKGLMTNLVAAGTDTSAVTLEWALAESIKNPRVADKAREEIERVLGGRTRMVDESDLSQLPYLQSIVKETLRLHPPVPLLVPHQSMQPCTVMGYHVPRGASLLVNAYGIGRDAGSWGEDALIFRPERFDGRDIDARGRDFELLPFGSGRRACPGAALAMITVYLTLANLLHGFDWKVPAGESIDTINEQYGLTLLMARKLRLIATPRLPHSAFFQEI